MSQMTYDQFLTRGLDGTGLWDTIKYKCVSHNDMLAEMRSRQEQLAAYAKSGASLGQKVNGMDQVQHSLIQDIKFLETMAWRLYMFGKRDMFSIKPGKNGEYLKRKRTDPKYWKMRSLAGERKADKWLKVTMRSEWEKEILKAHTY